MLNSYLHTSIADAFEEDESLNWKDSPFEKLIIMSNDARGRWGEKLIAKLLSEAGFYNTWFGGKKIRDDGGTYDIKLHRDSNHRVEVKTATSFKTWQHEPIYREDLWDLAVFADIKYSSIVFTIFDRLSILDILVPEKAKHPVLGKGATLRKHKDGGYKLDFSSRTHSLCLENDWAFEYDLNEPDMTGLISFIRRRING